MRASPRHHHSKPARWPMAFTLLEMVIVVAILVVLAGLVLPQIGNFKDMAAQTGTLTTLNTVRDSILGGNSGRPGYRSDMGSLPTTLRDLFLAPNGAGLFDPLTGRGWNGPYVQGGISSFQVDTPPYANRGDPAPLDAWNHLIVLQYPDPAVVDDPSQRPTYARLVSPGPDGVIQTPAKPSSGLPYPTKQECGDDVVIFLYKPELNIVP